MSDRTTRTIEIDPDTDQWLTQSSDDPDDLVNDLLQEYREIEES